MKKVTLSLVISAFNEAEVILNHIDELNDWLNNHMPDLSYEIIVVDDGSTDDTYSLLNQAKDDRAWLKVIKHSCNKGRGRGIRTGFEHSEGEYIICLDADLSYAPDHIPKLLRPLIEDEADITLASPHHQEGSVKNVPKQRAWLSKWGNRILSLSMGMNIATVTCIVRGFKRQVLKELELINDGKELHLEIIQKANMLNYRILEVPASLVWRDKKRGRSKRKFPEIALYKMRKTVLSHLIYNFISNPGIMLSLPILLLLTVILSGSGIIIYYFIHNLISLDLSLVQTLRKTLLDGELSFFLVVFSTIILMIFVAFYFISFQLKHCFDELYILSMRFNARLKKLEQSSESEQQSCAE